MKTLTDTLVFQNRAKSNERIMAQKARALEKRASETEFDFIRYDISCFDNHCLRRYMEIELQLSEQEQQWLEEIAEHYQLTLDKTIRFLIKEHHEHLAMELAFDKYPEGKLIEQSGTDSDNRSARKAALKRVLIEKASQHPID